jgi:hypothetical protein
VFGVLMILVAVDVGFDKGATSSTSIMPRPSGPRKTAFWPKAPGGAATPPACGSSPVKGARRHAGSAKRSAV